MLFLGELGGIVEPHIIWDVIYVFIGKLQPSTATLLGTDDVKSQSRCVQRTGSETIEIMTRPDGLSVPISGWSQQRSRLDTQLEDAPQEVRHAQQEHAWSEAQTHVQHV